MPESDRKTETNEEIDRMEVIFAVILLIATVTSALCAYEATRWSGDKNSLTATSDSMTTESIRASNEANRQILVDVSVFLAWTEAKSENDTVRTGFIESRFTPQFKPAFEAWIAEAQGQPSGTIPPGTPFSLPQYNLSAQVRSEQLQENATAVYNQAKLAGEISDRYLLNAVLFTIVLFLCSIGMRWKHDKIRRIILVSTTLFFILAISVFLWLPKISGF
jgi:hypothetical protein